MTNVIYVLGLSYCGSSLCNLLLNTHPEVVGLGEVHRLYNERDYRFCGKCGPEPCTRYADWEDDFYDHVAEIDQTKWLVDSSKNIYHMTQYCTYYPVLLSKNVYQFVASFKAHYPDYKIEDMVYIYGRQYAKYIEKYPLVPRITYKQLATDPQGTVDEIYEYVGLDTFPIDGWFKPQNHVFGGNAAVIQQTQPVFEPVADKYIGHEHEIFYDDSIVDVTIDTKIFDLMHQLGHTRT